MTRQGWMASGACVTTAPGLPWTTDTDELPTVVVDLMKATCAACPVRALCDLYVVAAEVEGGFWAGRDRDPHKPWEGVEWVPVERRSGRVLDEQGTLPLVPLDVLGGAA
jgi:hypothetical protein